MKFRLASPTRCISERRISECRDSTAFPSNAIGVGWPKIVGPDGVLEVLDHVSVLKGKHAFKFGGEFINNMSTTDETANAKGQIRFRNLNNFMEGNLKQGALFLGDARRTLYNYAYAAFLQDDWRIKPRLTLNLGVRYELNTVVHERDGLMGNFDPVLGLYQTNNPYHGDHNNFSPRVGFAWDVFGDGKTVLRGGAGILYEQLSFDVMNGEGNLLGLRTFPTGLPQFNAGSTTPLPLAGNIQLQSLTFAQGSSTLGPIDAAWKGFNPALPVSGQTTLFSAVSSPACGDGFTTPPGYVAAPGPCEVYGVNPNIRTPYVGTWNLDIQRAITNNLSIDIGYVGNHGTKLLGKLNINQPAPGSGWNLPLTATAQANARLRSRRRGLHPGPSLRGHGRRRHLPAKCNSRAGVPAFYGAVRKQNHHSRRASRPQHLGRTFQPDQLVPLVPELHHHDSERLRVEL